MVIIIIIVVRVIAIIVGSSTETFIKINYISHGDTRLNAKLFRRNILAAMNNIRPTTGPLEYTNYNISTEKVY